MNKYFIFEGALERTFKSSDLPPYGRLYRYLIFLAALIYAITLGQDYDSDKGLISTLNLPEFISYPLAFGSIAIFVFLVIRFQVSLWKKPKVKNAFVDALKNEIKKALYD